MQSALSQFFMPAENALLPSLVAADQLPVANSLNALNNNIARLAGPAIGGLLAAAIGLSGIVLVDALSFLPAAALVAGIRGSYSVARDTSERRPGVRRELAATHDGRRLSGARLLRRAGCGIHRRAARRDLGGTLAGKLGVLNLLTIQGALPLLCGIGFAIFIRGRVADRHSPAVVSPEMATARESS